MSVLNSRFVFVIAVASGIAIGAARAQTPDSKNGSASPPLSFQDLQIIQAIKDIRQQIGGLNLGGQIAPAMPGDVSGNSDLPPLGLLPGVSETELEQQFDRELRRRVTAPAANALGPAEMQKIAQPRTPPRPDQGALHISSLRAAARYLDLAAAELEDISSFQSADQLRKRADEFRKSARKLVRIGQIQSPRQR